MHNEFNFSMLLNQRCVTFLDGNNEPERSVLAWLYASKSGYPPNIGAFEILGQNF